MKRWKDGERWHGGYVRVRGRRASFIVERRQRGRRWHFSTRCGTEAAALKVLQRFEADPLSFELGQRDTVELSADLIRSFRAWQTSGPDAVTHKHALYTTRYLADWARALGAKDLRGLTVPELKRTLARWRGSHGLRIAALKVFFGWLRKEEGLLRHVEDVTLDLPVPQAVPAQRKKKKALDVETVRAVFALLSEGDRDIVTLLSATGWHLSEVSRFAKGGELTRDAAGRAVVSVKHKLGDVTFSTLANEEQAEAAQRLRTKVLVAPYNFSRRFAKAAEKAGVGHITAGVFRHTVATWAVASGMSIADVAKRLNHRDPRTTRDFYADMRAALPAFPEVHLSRPALPSGLPQPPSPAPSVGEPSE